MFIKISVFIFIIGCAFALPCSGDKRKKEIKVGYEFPPAMADAVKSEFTKQCDKGQILYNLSCAGCHNTVVNGQIIIPDWTQAQLVGYELRVLNPKHEAGIPEENVSAEDLGLIMTFLNYKKKNK